MKRNEHLDSVLRTNRALHTPPQAQQYHFFLCVVWFEVLQDALGSAICSTACCAATIICLIWLAVLLLIFVVGPGRPSIYTRSYHINIIFVCVHHTRYTSIAAAKEHQSRRLNLIDHGCLYVAVGSIMGVRSSRPAKACRQIHASSLLELLMLL